METLELVLGIVLLAMSVFLIIAVLMQSSKNHRLSGTIAGGAETFFGKTKGKTIDALLSKLTTVISIIFVLCVMAIFIIQPNAANANKAPVVPDTAPVAEGEAAPAEGEAAPAEGEAAPAEGEAAPAEGEAAPAEGEAAPAEGEAAPADGEAAPAEGEAA